MTVSTELRKAGPFIGDDSNKNLPFAFRVFKTSDVRVVWQHDGIEEDLILTTNYSVTLNANQNGNPGGVVILNIPISVGHTVTLTSKVPYTQGLDIVNAGGFYPDILETVFDKIVIMIQQVAEQIGRAVKLPISGTVTADELVQRLMTVEVSASAAEAAATAAQDAAASVVDTGLKFKAQAGVALTTSATLTSGQSGTFFEVQVANIQPKLPAISGLNLGICYTFKADQQFVLDGNGANIHPSGGDIAGTLTVRKGETIVVVNNGSSTGWYVLLRGFSKEDFLTHPVTPKLWLNCGSNGVIYSSYNVTSIADIGTGQVQVNVGNDFTDSNYVVIANPTGGNDNKTMATIINGPGQFTVYSMLPSSGAGIDPSKYAILAIGNQA